MSNKRITDLTELTNPTSDDVFPVVDIASNTTTKVQLGNLPVQTAVTTALATKENTITPGTTAQYFRGDKSFQTLDKTAVGLANVDNTSDANKPVSTAQQTALNAKQDSLVSGTNIKTVNSTSVLGSGNIAVQPTLVSGVSIKTVNSTSLLGSGDIPIPIVTPSGVSGAIQFSNGSAFASDATNFFWDDTNNRLGIGTNAPTYSLHVINTAKIQNFEFIGGDLFASTNIRFFPTGGMSISKDYSYAPANTLLHIKGSGSTSATTSLLVQNSAGASSLRVLDNGSVTNYGGTKSSNAAFGVNALVGNTSGDYNTAYGAFAMQATSSGSENTAIGYASLINNNTGGQNVAIGYAALYRANTSGNTAVGYNALFDNTAANNTALGAGTVSGNFAGSVILGKDATATAANQFVVGSTGTNAGSVNSTSDVPATFLWSVRINGTNYKILMTS